MDDITLNVTSNKIILLLYRLYANVFSTNLKGESGYAKKKCLWMFLEKSMNIQIL